MLIRFARIVGAVAIAVGAGSWLLNDPAPPPVPMAQPLPAPSAAWSASAVPGRVIAVKAGAATPASAAAQGAPSPSPRTPDPSASDDLRKVLLALEDDATPAQARRAADMLGRCEHAESSTQFAYDVRDQGGPLRKAFERVPGFSVDQMIKESQDRQRRCQIFDAATLARRGELLRRAYEAELPGMALEYLLWLNTHPHQGVTQELLAKLQRELRQTAEDGDMEALMAFSHSFGTLAETAMQRQAYKEAWLRIVAETSGPAVTQESRDSMENLERKMRQGRWAAPALSANEQREVDALMERVVEAWRRRH